MLWALGAWFVFFALVKVGIEDQDILTFSCAHYTKSFTDVGGDRTRFVGETVRPLLAVRAFATTVGVDTASNELVTVWQTQ